MIIIYIEVREIKIIFVHGKKYKQMIQAGYDLNPSGKRLAATAATAGLGALAFGGKGALVGSALGYLGAPLVGLKGGDHIDTVFVDGGAKKKRSKSSGTGWDDSLRSSDPSSAYC